MLKKGSGLKIVAIIGVVVAIAQADIIHQTTQWQSLGFETIKDGIATNSNNGVFWRLSSTDPWTLAVSGTEFKLNQTVEFKVEVWKEYQGTHFSDVAKVWMDGVEQARGEWLLEENGNTKTIVSSYWVWEKNKLVKKEKKEVICYYDDVVTDASGKAGPPELIGTLVFTYTFSEVRDYELIARVMCSDDLANLVTTDGSPTRNITYVNSSNKISSKQQKLPTKEDWEAFTAAFPNRTYQGEIERYTFKVTRVPEPTFIYLLASGLLVLFFVRRKKIG